MSFRNFSKSIFSDALIWQSANNSESDGLGDKTIKFWTLWVFFKCTCSVIDST